MNPATFNFIQELLEEYINSPKYDKNIYELLKEIPVGFLKYETTLSD